LLQHIRCVQFAEIGILKLLNFSLTIKKTVMKTTLILGAISVSFFLIISGFKKNEKMVNSVDIGVVVSDLQRSLTFYTTVLGMEQIDTWHASKEMSTTYGVNSGKAFDIINLKLDCDGYVLKYKLNNTPVNKLKDSTVNNENEKYAFEKLGTRYLTINVKSIDPFIERIKANQIKYKLVTFPDGWRVVLVHDPDGALLEIAGN
jgi:catechol 2,3-dioxygenase-like lactoylglutathione lyase family enzyme